MSDLDDLRRIQQDTQDMLGDFAVFEGIMWVLAISGIVGALIWIGYLIF